MRVAVTYRGGKVFQHFGHSTHFKLYDIENGELDYDNDHVCDHHDHDHDCGDHDCSCHN